MTPIEKNIIVVDEFGNEHTPTYAKRAKGLVKHGRARWLDENTICLTCPPETLNSEDMNMENRVEMSGVEIERAEELLEKRTAEDMPGTGFTAQDILSRLDRIAEQGDQLAEIIQKVRDLPVNNPGGGMEDTVHMADVICQMYADHEKTNRKQIKLLTRMYRDIAPKRAGTPDERREEILNRVKGIRLAGADPEAVETLLRFYERMLDKI